MGGSAVDVASGRERAAGDCCIDGERIRLIGVVPRSDGEGEFGEGRREPMLWVEVYAEFVVAAADVLDECVSGTDHAGRAEPFEATPHGLRRARPRHLNRVSPASSMSCLPQMQQPPTRSSPGYAPCP